MKQQPRQKPTFDSASEGPSRWVATATMVFARPAAAWVVLAACLIATSLASVSAWRQVRSRHEVRFNLRTEALQKAIGERLERYVRLLKGANGLFAASQSVEREEWRAYVESLALSDSMPGLQAVGYVENVPMAELPRFLERTRHDMARDYDPAGFRVWPLAPRNNYYVVKYVEPLERNRSAMGFDIGSEPTRREAAEQSRDSGKATMTHKVTLVQSPQSPGALLLLPIYRHGTYPTNLEQRRANLEGWVYAAFVIEDMMAGLGWLNRDELDFEIFDGTQISAETRLFASEGPGARGTCAHGATFRRTSTLQLENLTWTLHFCSHPTFEQAARFSAPGYLAAGGLGLCISLLAFGIARSLATARQRGLALANQMTAQLRLQERAMISAKNGIFILDATRDCCPIIYANPAFERMTGYTARDHLGRETLFLLRGSASQMGLPGIRTALQAGGHDHAVVREYRKDGSPFWAEFSLSPVRDERGQMTHYLGIVEDVTERQRAAEQLAKAERRYHDLVDNLTVGVYRNTPGETGRFVEANPAAVAMFEAGSKEAFMQHAVSEFYVDPARRKAFSGKIIRDGFVIDEELELRTLKGRRFWASVTAAMKRDEEGGVFFDGVITDITERKAAEEKLQRACAELSESQARLEKMVEQLRASHAELEKTQFQLIQAAKLESIGSLAAGVAHEVKNPLQTILMGVDYLTNSLQGVEECTHLALGDMRDAVKRADIIVRELLHFSAAAHFELRPEDLNAVVERSLRLLNSELMAARIEVQRALQDGLPPVRIDKGKMEQVLINLLINALQAMPQNGTLTVRTRGGRFGDGLAPSLQAHPHFKPGDPVVVTEVQDTGPGIPEAHLARVFDPFFTTKPVGTGTGLGLSVVKKIMDFHEGAIEVRNGPRGGALVTLILRAA